MDGTIVGTRVNSASPSCTCSAALRIAVHFADVLHVLFARDCSAGRGIAYILHAASPIKRFLIYAKECSALHVGLPPLSDIYSSALEIAVKCCLTTWMSRLVIQREDAMSGKSMVHYFFLEYRIIVSSDENA
jgi:hypothetical protein